VTLARVTRSGSHLQVGGSNIRLSGINAYWMGLNDNAGTSSGLFPSHAEITAAFDGMQAMGVKIVRIHTLGMNFGTPNSYLTGYTGTTPTYVEVNLDSADWALYQAGLHGIRVITSMCDNWNYYHGGLWWFVHQAYLQNPSGLTDIQEGYSGGTGKDSTLQRQFFANTTAGLRIRALFFAYIAQILGTHVNPYNDRQRDLLRRADRPRRRGMDAGHRRHHQGRSTERPHHRRSGQLRHCSKLNARARLLQHRHLRAALLPLRIRVLRYVLVQHHRRHVYRIEQCPSATRC
jgi:hypothetical protein